MNKRNGHSCKTHDRHPGGGRKGATKKRLAPGWGLVCANDQGEFWDVPGFLGAGRSGTQIRRPADNELSPLPEAAVVQYAPDRQPLAWEATDSLNAAPIICEGTLALAAQLPSGWTRTLLPAWERLPQAADLPIFGYTAVFYRDDRLWCAAVQTENNPRWNPREYAKPELPQLIAKLKAKLPGNRLLNQLEVCALQYGCYNAQNVFCERWEGAVPVSPMCNAGCRGCISLQPDGAPPSPQIRLNFTPTLEEVVELGLHHLQNPQAILAFGQGCEGEPLLQASLIAQAVKRIRQETDRGTLHINSNGSLTKGAEACFAAGLTSIRVSLNSVVPETYQRYYQPRGYTFADVQETVRRARAHGVWVSLNLLLMPGLTDRPAEVEALLKFIIDNDVNMIQLRNLNMDPDLLLSQIGLPDEPGMGVAAMLDLLRREAPQVRLGNHNPHLRD